MLLQWQKSKYSRKMKKKIRTMLTNVTKEYPKSEKVVRGNNENKGIPKTINQRRLTKEKRVPNQWPDHPM